MNKDRRDFEVELRAIKQDDGKKIIKGLAVCYGKKSRNLGGFTETIERGAFNKLLNDKNLDVVALFNHDSNNILGRTPNTLKLRDTKEGLEVSIELPDNELGHKVYDAVDRGDIRGQSFAFSDFKCSWNKDFTERNITSIGALYDVGPVTYPAYPDTNIFARSREKAMADCQNKNKNKKDHKMDPKSMREDAQNHSATVEAINAKAVAEKRELSSEEVVIVSELQDKIENLIKNAEVFERSEAIKAKLNAVAAPVAPAIAPNMQRAMPVQRVEVINNRYNLRSFKADQFGSHAKANEVAHRSGMFILASLFRNEKAQEWCRMNGVDFNRQERAQSISVNAQGGYLVPDELETAIINITEQYGVARKLAKISRMNSDHKIVPIRSSGLTAYAVGEGGSIGESDKDWSSAELVARKWAVLAKMSSEIAEDAIIDIADDLAMEMGVSFAGTEDDCFFNGDGTSAYHGIRGIHNLIEGNSVYTGCYKASIGGHDTLSEVTSDDLSLLYGAMPEKYTGGVWVCKKFTKAAVFDRLLVAAGGNMNSQIANGQPSSYMGYDIITSDKMYAPATGSTVANGKVPVLFGRFDIGVLFGARRGVTIAVSNDRYFETDQIAIRGTERFDIVAHNANCGSDIGPVVGLALTT